MTKKEIKKLDDIWRVLVKKDANYRCEISGQTKDQCQLHSHHFIGRANRATRWYLPNGVCLSASCHKLSLWSAHENPEWFRAQMLDRRGDKWRKDVVRQSTKTFKGTYRQVLDYLEGRSKNYL